MPLSGTGSGMRSSGARTTAASSVARSVQDAVAVPCAGTTVRHVSRSVVSAGDGVEARDPDGGVHAAAAEPGRAVARSDRDRLAARTGLHGGHRREVGRELQGEVELDGHVAGGDDPQGLRHAVRGDPAVAVEAYPRVRAPAVEASQQADQADVIGPDPVGAHVLHGAAGDGRLEAGEHADVRHVEAVDPVRHATVGPRPELRRSPEHDLRVVQERLPHRHAGTVTAVL